MKTLLRKLLFWDAPAQGVCFALTFFFVGSSLWFTLYQMLWLSSCGLVQLNFTSERCAVEIGVWAGAQILITAYSLIVLWLQVARDKSYMLNQYLSEDFSAFNAPPSMAYIFTSMLNPAFKSASNKFKSVTARTRCMQALMKAEAYRREHGDFPEALPDLPLDPFTGSPLLYKYGTVECLDYVPQASAVFSPPNLKNVKAVQVWSVGSNGKDDGGLKISIYSTDDPCARIRLE